MFEFSSQEYMRNTDGMLRHDCTSYIGCNKAEGGFGPLDAKPSETRAVH